MAEGLHSLASPPMKAQRKRNQRSLRCFGYTQPLLNGPMTMPSSLLHPCSSAGTHSLTAEKKEMNSDFIGPLCDG